jgi:hypothetical protein
MQGSMGAREPLAQYASTSAQVALCQKACRAVQRSAK